MALDERARRLRQAFSCEGFLGKGSTFTEYYRVVGKTTGTKTVMTEVRYNDNKATDPNGNDLDG